MLYAPLAFFALLAGFFFYALDVRKDRPNNELASVLIDQPFPSFELSDLDGAMRGLGDLVNGEVTLVNIWASWCPSCRDEHPFLARLSEEGVRIVGLNYKDKDDLASAWLDYYGDIYDFNIADKAGRLGLDLGVYGAPETYLVDAKGIIRYKRVGVVNSQIWAELEPLYSTLVAEAKAGN